MEKFSPEAKNFLLKIQGKTVVFTNGCFDILHSGHVTYLNEAKAMGDILFVGLNSDDSIKKLKGPDRPFNSQLDRKLVLENLRSVDFVEIFNEETPLELIKFIRPSFLVKGGDYEVAKIVGAEFVLSYGGAVKNLTFVENKSTSSLIDRIELVALRKLK